MFMLFFSPVFTGIVGQKVRVEEELEAYPTESVELRCKFIDGGGPTKLTQVQRQCFITLSPRNVMKCIMLPASFRVLECQRNTHTHTPFVCSIN